jgi:NIPSNAP
VAAQLREYTVKPGEMDAWIKEWREHVVPLRRAFGFHVVGAWTIAEVDEFVWIIRYEGQKSWRDADADYYNSPQRKALQPDPARHLAHTRARMMEDVAG